MSSPPTGYPAQWVETIVLPDGLTAIVRPILPDDAPALQAGFKRLSEQSRFLRFLETSNELSDEQARQFAALDYQERMAIVATTDTPEGPLLIGVARYAMLGRERPGVAECAIVVGDPYQRRGLGARMMTHLARYAYEHGVRMFTGTIHITNAPMLRFIKRAGLPYARVLIEPGVWEVRVKLDQLPTGGS